MCNKPIGVCSNPTGVCNNPTGMCSNPTGMCNNPTGMCNNPTGMCNKPIGVCSNPTGVCNNPTGMCSNPTGMCNNPIRVCSNPPGVYSIFQVMHAFLKEIHLMFQEMSNWVMVIKVSLFTKNNFGTRLLTNQPLKRPEYLIIPAITYRYSDTYLSPTATYP